MASVGEPIFLDAGEAALVVEFGRTVDPAAHNRVLSLDAAMAACELPGVVELVPTIRSLMIHYDPLVIDRTALVDAVRNIETAAADTRPVRRWTIPCCYDPTFGEDITQVADQLGMTPERVVALHSGATYRAYMYGFLPGFCYLGGLPKELTVSRRVTIRPPHPSGTIMIGAGMGLITTFAMPTGWWLIGRTPERMFSLAREQTFLAAVGDEIKFEPIDLEAFHALDRRAERGEVVATVTALP
ncbi:MAG: carboxyltransferase domain-containing protein [Rhizobiales bacterium]|nr:carboxyltransferase domain-containing protein [Hyphomicrobiales bacterium]